MISRRRIRNVALALAFYGLAGAAVGYFAYHAQTGDRGLVAKSTYKARMTQIEADIAVLKAERSVWERRVALMRSDNLDRDVLDERARALLNTAHRNDVVVILQGQ